MNVLVVCAGLFCLGLYGVLVRRDIVGVLASVEVMLGAASIQLVALARSATSGGPDPASTEAVGLIVLVLAAAEAAVGLALLLTIVRRSGRGRVDELVEVEG